MKMRVCARCGTEVQTPSEVEGYDHTCPWHDEDLYENIETVEVDYSGVYLPLDGVRAILQGENAVVATEDVDPLMWALYNAALRSGLHRQHRSFLRSAVSWFEDTVAVEDLNDHDASVLAGLIEAGKKLLNPDLENANANTP